MRKLAARTVLASVIFAGGVAHAAPEALKCKDSASRNCFKDEIFLLDGDEQVMKGGALVPLVGCKSGADCYLNDTSELYKSTGLTAAVVRALELVRAGGATIPEWDEVVVFTADFGPTRQPGPLFFRQTNAAGEFVNRVSNIGLPELAEPDPDKPFVGVIDGGNVKGIGANPTTGTYAPCGRNPRRLIDRPAPSTEQPNGAICPPGLFTYFDALAQATAQIYGPSLAGPNDVALVTLPATKSALVTAAGESKFPDSGLSLNVWNAFLDTRGSVLGGNTWRDNGNGTFEAVRPPLYHGASPPFDARQMVRFQPIDLYLLGFAPAAEVPPLRSFTAARPGDVYYPASQAEFSATAGPNMGTRIGGVQLRGRSGVPTEMPFSSIVAANGGERTPGPNAAPQQIRQLWILVTKPTFLRDLVAKEAYDAAVKAAGTGTPPDMQKILDESKAAQDKEQDTEISNLQKFRRSWNQYFYTLAGYRGRVVTTFEGKVDDMAYWEFADATDESPLFSAGGGLQLTIPPADNVPNAGAAKQSVLRVLQTPGEVGTITFTPRADLPVVIQGSAKASTAPNNVFSVRMRLPEDPQLAGKVKAKVVLRGAAGTFEFSIPSDPGGFLVPDGRFRTYSVLISQTLTVEPDTDETTPATEKIVASENTAFTGKDYTSFTLTPSNVALSNLDIEFIKLVNSTELAETDKDCSGKLQPDGFMGAEDNCPNTFNPTQADSNADGVGDACEDFDGDQFFNACDNCPGTGNATQTDEDGNGTGDACDPGFEDSGCAIAVKPSTTPNRLAFLSLGVLALAALRRLGRRSRSAEPGARLD